MPQDGKSDTHHIHCLVKHPWMYIVFPLQKTSEQLHLHSLCKAVSCDAIVTGFLSLTLAHALGGALVLADGARICLVAKDIFLGCIWVSVTRRDKQWLCLGCGRKENKLLCCLRGAKGFAGDDGCGF